MIHKLLAGLALTSLMAAPVSAGEGGTERPFRGEGVGVIEFQGPQEAIVNWVGTATHLGKFTRQEFLFINDDGFTFQGYMVYTAANGDELTLDFSGMFISPTDAIGSYTFTGGTGRFADATGVADFYATTPDFVTATVTFDGVISY